MAGASVSRVTLGAQAIGNGTPAAWPAVQLVFVIETTPYDGVFDYGAPDNVSLPCWLNLTPNWQHWPLCMESNAVPTFVANAGTIAENISASHPYTNVTFAMVDYFSTRDKWDDGDGNVYHVDISHFVPANQFGAAVRDTFQQEVLGGGWYLPGSELHDSILQSSIITALYGVLTGQGLNWSMAAHHVIVWMGSTTPRDPSYPINQCVSPSAWFPNQNNTMLNWGNVNSTGCQGPTSEPGYRFASGVVSPEGLGWFTGPNGSIAELAHTGLCAESLGGNCTIDEVVPNDLTVATSGGGPWTASALNNPAESDGTSADSWSFWNSSCALPNATDGTWIGPQPMSCYLSGQPTNWQDASEHWIFGYYDLECGYAVWTYGCTHDFISGLPGNNYTDPNTSANQHLVGWLGAVGLGLPLPGDRLVARPTPSHPMFLFVPYGNISAVPTGPFSITCTSQFSYAGACPTRPQFIPLPGNRTALGWNWSTDPVGDYMLANDSFTATFEVQATGPPYNTWVPVDACTTNWCLKQGSGPEDGLSSAVQYFSSVENTTVNSSFPLVKVFVETLSGSSTPPGSNPPSAPPSSPTATPPVGTPVGNPVPLPQPGAVLALVGVSVISLPAVTLGLIAMGFTRGAVRMRPLRVAVPGRMSQGARGGRTGSGSAFEKPNDRETPFGVRFE